VLAFRRGIVGEIAALFKEVSPAATEGGEPDQPG
jgi:hypothetical protein